MPTMSDKKIFRQIRNFYKKPKSNLNPPARKLILAYTRSTVKKIGLGSLGTKLLGDARFQVSSVLINLC